MSFPFLSVARRSGVMILPLLAACASGSPSSGPSSGPSPAPAPAPAAPVAAAPAPARADTPPVARPAAPKPRVAPPQVALQLGLMPLASTGVTSWRLRHPTWDGRGVLIGILDSGVDPGVAGLTTTSTGEPKILDLRDFSDEGLVALERAGDTWTGVLREIAFGALPEADLNGDGDNRDVFAVEVARDSLGWRARLDANGDGALVDERWRRDYLAARETFTFTSRAVMRGPVTAALNLDEVAGAPRLVVYLDNSGHGTHVTGIAAGHQIYGQPGLHGVAPGAQIIGLKIADNLRGGVTTTGSMARAMEYAVRFARARNLPLVLNMSFGIGNAQPGRAVMDSVVNAFLLANPDVFFAISAGNDGPGTETVGLPGSASLAASVGASYPSSIAAVQFDAPGEVLGWWSARGGSLARPDLVTPGLAYSTVPAWNSGDEVKGGTSMASPHAAGLAALLISAARGSGQPAPGGAQLLAALRGGARPLANVPVIDQGAGLPEIEAAWRWHGEGHEVVRFDVRALPPAPSRPVGLRPGGAEVSAAQRAQLPSAAFRRGGLAAGDTIQRFRVSVMPPAAARSRRYRLVSDAPWLRTTQEAVTIDSASGSAVIEVRYDAAALARVGRHSGAVTGVPEQDSAAGAAFTLLNTVIAPEPSLPVRVRSGKLSSARAARWFVRVPEGSAGLVVRASVRDTTMQAQLSLYEPSGRPSRGNKGESLGGESGRTAHVVIPADDVVPGVWEVVFQVMPGGEVWYDIDIEAAPVRIARVDAATGGVTLAGRGDTALASALDDVGIALSWTQPGLTGAAWRRAFDVPGWAEAMVVEVEVTPEVWNTVTDFAISVFDADGARLGNGAMNYPYHRVSAELPERRAEGYGVTLDLFPGFALPAAAAFDARIRVRFEGEPVSLARQAAAAVTERTLTPAVFTRAVPAGWQRLLRLTVGAREGDPVAITKFFTMGGP